MINRDISNELLFLSKQYPVVTIVGPRQAGKTTLSQQVFPEYHYVNLELPEWRSLAEEDPRAFFASNSTPLIIDEIQRVPSLLSYIQVQVDKDQKVGQYILTGSHQFQLQQAISQSLAGRSALLTLFPFSIKELSNAGLHYTRDEYLFQGFFPRIYQDHQEPNRSYRYYYQTYIERDIRIMSNIHNLNLFDKFIRLLAGRTGQVLNLHSLSSDVGVSSTTLHEWLSLLEASFIIYRLQPYYDNFGKRAIKSPKIYFTDVGLLCYLLGISEIHHVGRDPLIGGLFENMVVMEAIKTLLNQGKEPTLFFFRNNNQLEVDLLYQNGRNLVPIEIKSSMTFHPSFRQKLDRICSIVNASQAFILYAGELEIQQENVKIMHYTNTNQIFTHHN